MTVNGRGYAVKKVGGRKGKVLYVHRMEWERVNGPIPEGHLIHHRDGNRLNNDISNLECVSARTHLNHHHTSPLICAACGVKTLRFVIGQPTNRFCSRKCAVRYHDAR
jgi:hypothetical protein